RNVDPPAPAPGDAALPLTLPDNVLSQDARLTFSARAVNTRLSAADAIEVATADDSASAKLTVAGGGLQLLGGDVAVATLSPRALLGVGAVGAIKAFRDPFVFEDPASGQTRLLFAGSRMGSDSDWNGVVGA
ncbi:hypothetical protein LTR94_034377, partial [Friedmanniomyces endolithicus]